MENGWIIPIGMHRGHLSVTQPKMSPATVYLEYFSFFFCICLQGTQQGMVPATGVCWAGWGFTSQREKFLEFFIPALDLLPLVVSESFWEGAGWLVSPAGSRILHPS